MESITTQPNLEAKEPIFDRNLCIEASKQAIDSRVFDCYGDGVSLAEKFIPNEVLPGGQDGHIRLRSIDDNLDQIKAKFSLESDTYAEVVLNFGQKMLAEAIKHNLVENLEANQLEQFVGKHSAERINTDTSSKFGMLVSRGWQVYSNRQGQAVLILYEPKKEENSHLPTFRTVNLDALYKEVPDFVENNVRSLYRAGFEGKLVNIITYNLAAHDLKNSGLVPEYIAALAKSGETEIEKVKILMRLIVENEEGGSQMVYQFLKRLSDQTYAKIPNDDRNMYLDYYFAHLATCPAETDEVRAIARDRMNVLVHLKTINYSARSGIIVEGQETLQNPILHTPEFIEDVIRIEGNTLKKSKDFLQFINRTSSRRRSIEPTLKDLRRRMFRLYQFIERFKAALGESALGGSNFDEFFKEMVSRFSMDLGSSLPNYGIKSLDDAEKVVSQSLYPNAYRLAGNSEWVTEVDRRDPNRPQVNIRDEGLRDLLLYLAIKTAQQNSMSDSIRAGADKVIGWLKNKYAHKVEGSEQRLREYDLREKNIRKLMRKLGIPKHQISRLVKHVKKEKSGKYQTYDYSKFGVLYRTLVYSKQGLIDLESKAIEAVLKALYPNIKEEEWGLLKY